MRVATLDHALLLGALSKPQLGKKRNLYLRYIAPLVAAMVIAFCSAALMEAALADVSVTSARYSAGVLDLRGVTTQPKQLVGLDKLYFSRSDDRGRFHFRVQYLPNDCTVELSAGGRSRMAFIEGCLPN